MPQQKQFTSYGAEIQDIAGRPPKAEAGEFFCYHVHGRRQGYGTIKEHLDPECPVLKRWQPGRHPLCNSRLGHAIMRDILDTEKLTTRPYWFCKACGPP